ncbi:hypothetical protein CU097_011865 [Rhizopus azygosporus]|uniref:Uncharacterized protein n=1 Tax=Rhizopus azygosporus TaxID=86630 RepID=A0A367KEB6_RHIAZ|nr:hypothetical protein CU097_011865 [Rhizopus azygosporus]
MASSSPRFWQKLGLSKQSKTSDKKDRLLFTSSMIEDEKQLKHSSALRHRASSASIRISSPQLKRMTISQFQLAESVPTTKPVDQATIDNKRSSIPVVQSTSPPQRKSLERTGSRLKQSKSNQSLRSESTTTSTGSARSKTSRLRQPSPARLRLSKSASSASLNNKKSLPKMSDQANSKCCCDHQGLLDTIKSLEESLEKERAFSRSLQGQKEAIAKDLDYFCVLSDEITEERDRIKANYDKEKLENERLREALEDLQQVYYIFIIYNKTHRSIVIILESMKQQATEEHYAYYSNLQYKNEEISKLKNELKLAQGQIQVLRKTMEHMLKVDEQDLDDCETKRKSFYDTATTITTTTTMDVDLLLHNHPDHRSSTSDSSLSSTKPPSPTAYFEEDSEDESRESFLNEDRYLVKKRSSDLPKRLLRSQRRKNELEEMLGEVDSQLNKVKLRRPSTGN